MKSLKKVLSLVLALAMVLGTVAFAFADDAEPVEYSDAVKVLLATKTLIGDKEGNLNLEDSLTREQAAKLMAYFYAGMVKAEAGCVTLLFEDVDAERWSAKYVTLCAEAGIINGYNDTKFGPEDIVTGTQFAKMLLACLGYKDLTGQDWATKVAEALAKTEIVDLGAAPLTREQAAGLCFAALKSTVVNAKGESVKNCAFTETIANDGLLQLGELLYPELTCAKSGDKALWAYKGYDLGISEPLLEFEADKFEAAEVKEDGWTYPLIGIKRGLKAEDIVLFSKAEDGEYTPFLTAKAGETIYVKANRFTVNLMKYFNGALPETLSSKTVASKLTLEDLINFTGDPKTHNFLLSTTTHNKNNSLGEMLDIAFAKGYHNVLVGALNKLDEIVGRDDTIELSLVTEPKAGEAAVYCFSMPDRMVTSYDFACGDLGTFTFVNTRLVPETILYKQGEYGDLQEVVVQPFTFVTVTVPEGEKVYYQSKGDVRFFVGSDVANQREYVTGLRQFNLGPIAAPWNFFAGLSTKVVANSFSADGHNHVAFVTSPLLRLSYTPFFPLPTSFNFYK